MQAQSAFDIYKRKQCWGRGEASRTAAGWPLAYSFKDSPSKEELGVWVLSTQMPPSKSTPLVWEEDTLGMTVSRCEKSYTSCSQDAGQKGTAACGGPWRDFK